MKPFRPMPDTFCNRCGERRGELLNHIRVIVSGKDAPDECIYWRTLCDDCIQGLFEFEDEQGKEAESKDAVRIMYRMSVSVVVLAIFMTLVILLVA